MTQEDKNSIQIDGVFLNRRGGCSPRVQMDIEEGFADETLQDATICFEWSGNVGWGEAYINIDPKGKISWDTECMGIEFVELLLNKLYECVKRGGINND